jgi:hypothetical protein
MGEGATSALPTPTTSALVFTSLPDTQPAGEKRARPKDQGEPGARGLGCASAPAQVRWSQRIFTSNGKTLKPDRLAQVDGFTHRGVYCNAAAPS